MDKYTFGNKLYKLRTESNLTQKDLANILGVSDKAVSKWETGEAMPRVKTLKNMKLTKLFTRKESERLKRI